MAIAQQTQRRRQVPDSAFDLPDSVTPPITTSEPAILNRPLPRDQDDDTDSPWYENDAHIISKGGLPSRKRFHDEYQIVSRNDMDRRRGARQGGFITRGMLAMLAQHMRAQAGAEGEDGDEDDDGVEEDGCTVM